MTARQDAAQVLAAPSAEDREALRDDVMEAIEGAIPDDLPGYRQRYTDKAVERVLAVLAARQPAPTVSAEQRDEAIRVATAEVARQARRWPDGDGLLHDVPPLEAADAAVRAALGALGIEVTP